MKTIKKPAVAFLFFGIQVKVLPIICIIPSPFQTNEGILSIKEQGFSINLKTYLNQ
ncbi:MAG: hypothetical protein ACI8ZX_000222 [Planctomycetota bacterium]|jgi:hypothetical protein